MWNTYFTCYGLLGHIVGICRRKNQAEGKKVVAKGSSKQITKSGFIFKAPKIKMMRYVLPMEWLRLHAKFTNTHYINNAARSDLHSNTITTPPKMDLSNTSVKILTRPVDEVSNATRQALVNVGLIMDSEKEDTSNNIEVSESMNRVRRRRCKLRRVK